MIKLALHLNLAMSTFRDSKPLTVYRTFFLICVISYLAGESSSFIYCILVYLAINFPVIRENLYYFKLLLDLLKLFMWWNHWKLLQGLCPKTPSCKACNVATRHYSSSLNKSKTFIFFFRNSSSWKCLKLCLCVWL